MKIQRLLIPGSEWLYLKLYVGVQVTNSILVNYIKPLVFDLLNQKIIEKFFFIRYSDTSNHIRLRLKLYDKNNIGNLIIHLYNTFYALVESGIIWNIQYGSYLREIERYGGNTMEITETIFFHDSQIVLNILSLPEINKTLVSLLLIDQYLTLAQYTVSDKQEFCQKMSTIYQDEFNLRNPKGFKQLNQKYRLYKNSIHSLFEKPKENYLKILQLHQKYMYKLFKQINSISNQNKLEIPLEKFISSIIHMFLDRLCTSDNRLYELVCYYLLEKYYLSIKYKIEK